MSWNPLAVRCFKRKWERGTKENKWETNGDEKFQKLSLCSIHIIFHLFDINFHSKQCECMNFYDNTRNTYVKSHLTDVRFIFVCLTAFCAAQLANAIAYLSTRHIESVHSDAYVLLVLWTDGCLISAVFLYAEIDTIKSISSEWRLPPDRNYADSMQILTFLISIAILRNTTICRATRAPI